MKHLDLFSGIGGFALAAQSVWGSEYENVGFCDNEPFSQAILKKHWPYATIYQDIKEIRTPPAADLITGGFPCQPFSSAGHRRGTQDDRYLWPEMLRVVQLSAPRWVIGENVNGLLTWNGGMVLDSVCTDLEASGYEVWPVVLPAASVGAPHYRYRVWIIAHSNIERRQGGDRRTYKKKQRGAEALDAGYLKEDWKKAAARLCSVDDGLPGGLARPRGWRNAALKGAGNAVVPQVAAQIMLAIRAVDSTL